MNKQINETKIIKWIIVLPIAGVILTSFILTNIFISSMNEAHKLETSNIKQNHINNLKNKIKERIESLSLLLTNTYEIEVSEAENAMKDITNIGHKKLKVIYEDNKHLPKEEIFKIINQQLKDIRFFEANSYYFVCSIEGEVICFPPNNELIGKTNNSLVDIDGKKLHTNFLQTIEKKGEGFTKWDTKRKGSNKKLKKLGYVKLFKPLGIYIGTSIFLDDIKKQISKNAINFIENLYFENNGYIFILNSKKRILSHKNKAIVNIPFEKLDKKTQKNFNDHLLQAKADKGSFVKYNQSQKIFKDFNETKKISYIKYIPFLDWIIGTGLYTDKLDIQLLKKKEQLELKLENDIKTIILVSFLVSLIVITLLILLSKKIKNIFQYYSKSLENSNLELKILNEKLEQKVQNQVDSIRQKDKLLNQQSKLAAMGELLGNIAHQWRQPLSAISTIASGLIIQKEIGTFKEEHLDKDLKAIINSTKILSNTIDDFRNFTSKDKLANHFKINDTIKKVLNLISGNLQNHEIKLVQNIDNIELYNYENELIQTILNILNNAKDALQESKEDQKYIFINVKKSHKNLLLEIYDNAGGIKEDIIERIFEPYFTTKFKSQGTGIGLYMTKNILETSCKGKIQVENKRFIYNDKNYEGALFKIELPLNINL